MWVAFMWMLQWHVRGQAKRDGCIEFGFDFQQSVTTNNWFLSFSKAPRGATDLC